MTRKLWNFYFCSHFLRDFAHVNMVNEFGSFGRVRIRSLSAMGRGIAKYLLNKLVLQTCQQSAPPPSTQKYPWDYLTAKELIQKIREFWKPHSLTVVTQPSTLYYLIGRFLTVLLRFTHKTSLKILFKLWSHNAFCYRQYDIFDVVGNCLWSTGQAGLNHRSHT